MSQHCSTKSLSWEDLNPFEQQKVLRLIEAEREAEAKRKAHLEYSQTVLETASKYNRWLIETGRGDSYTTFLENFSYLGDQARPIHQRATELIKLARG